MKKLLIFMLMSFIFAGNAFAADIDLGEGYRVPEGFSSVLITSSDGTAIQNAVNHIQADGTILLSGTFNLKRNINIKKNLTIKGDNNKAVLDASAVKDRVIRCQGDITLENLTIKGGSSTNGGGLKLDGGSVTIISCDITNNTGILGGGGIHSQANTLTLTNCNILNNTVLLSGGGLSLLGGTVTMTNCVISGDNAGVQGGGLATALAYVTMTECTVTGNTAGHSGGGLMISSGSLTVTSCDISGNTAKASADIELVNNPAYTNNK